MQIRRSSDRGRTLTPWLDSRHTFSFASYHDPAFMGFGDLRVINEDRVKPGAGFATHAHRDMEILSWVLEGAMEHRDSTGSGGVIRPGDLQTMSAGTGVTHSEMNASKSDPLHFLQIWVLPAQSGLEPGYQQVAFTAADLHNHWRVVASPDGRDGSVRVHQAVSLSVVRLDRGHSIEQRLGKKRRGWLQVAHGSIGIDDGAGLDAGDGAAWIAPARFSITAQAPAELLWFDLDA
jgi:redox-sensitive bicupin YhaK (pirin superfamily)